MEPGELLELAANLARAPFRAAYVLLRPQQDPAPYPDERAQVVGLIKLFTVVPARIVRRTAEYVVDDVRDVLGS